LSANQIDTANHDLRPKTLDFGLWLDKDDWNRYNGCVFLPEAGSPIQGHGFPVDNPLSKNRSVL
jgi:hypothetical protein